MEIQTGIAQLKRDLKLLKEIKYEWNLAIPSLGSS